MPTIRDHRDRLGPLLARVGQSAWASFEEALAPLALRPRHVVVLMEIAAPDGLSQGALSETLGFDPAVVVGLLNELDRQGLVVRERDPADRRRHLVRLTPRGRDRLEQVNTALTRVEDQLLAPLDADARERLRAALRAIEEAMG